MTSTALPFDDQAHASSTRMPWIMLFSRVALFLGIQLVFALGFTLAGSGDAWKASAAWWPLVVLLANLVCLAALTRLFRLEGKNYWSIFRIQTKNIKSDLLVLLPTLLLAGPAGYFPNVILAAWLFGSSETVLNLFIGPLPLWVVYTVCLVLFPITQGLTELPTYFLYVMPRLQAKGLPRWLAVMIPSLMLGLQHIAIPFVPDLRFIAWRALMFIPFALVVGIALHLRPRLLPYIAVIHVLMDASLASMFLAVAY